MALADDLAQAFQNPLVQTGLGMLGSTQTPGPAYMQAAQNARAAQAAQQELAMRNLALQQAQNRMNFNPSAYMIGNRQPVAAAGPATTAALQQQQGQAAGGQMAASAGATDQSVQAMQPPGAIGNIDYAGLLQAGTQANMSPEEMQAAAQMMDPRTALLMKLAAQPAIVVGPGATPEQPGLEYANQIMNPGKTPQSAGQQSGNAPGGLYPNTNLPPDSQAAQIGYLQKLRDAQPQGSDAFNNYQSAIDKMTGKFEQNLQTSNQDIRKGQLETQNQFKTQAQSTALGAQLEKMGIPQTEETLQKMEQLLQKYPTGQLPGFGPAGNTLANHGLGFLQSGEAQSVRQQMQPLINMELHARNGARITPPEVQRIQQELGTGSYVSEDRLRQGISSMRQMLEAQKRNVVAATPGNVLDDYEQRGGLQLRGGGQATGQTTLAPASGYNVSDIDAAIARKQGGK